MNFGVGRGVEDGAERRTRSGVERVSMKWVEAEKVEAEYAPSLRFYYSSYL